MMRQLQDSMRGMSLASKKGNPHEDFPGQHNLALPAQRRRYQAGTQGPTGHMTDEEQQEFEKGKAAAERALAIYRAQGRLHAKAKGHATFDHHTPAEVLA